MAQSSYINPNKDKFDIELRKDGDEIVHDDNGEPTTIWSLEWQTEQHTKEWYMKYAKVVGFGVRVDSGTRISGTQEWKQRTWVCNKQGYRTTKNIAPKKFKRETRCGCEALFSAELNEHGKWWARRWISHHVHPPITPSKTHLIRSHRQISEFHQTVCGDADDAGIRPKLAHDLMAIQAGGKEKLKFTIQDQKNYLNVRRSGDMGGRSFQAIVNYFGSDFENNCNRFYKMKLDEDDFIENIFWADHIMQNDYIVFGDFVLFDTTYQTNADNLPLGVFIRVNNHGGQVVFGACLLYSENAAAFQWVFEVFLECMKGRAPKSIITDQDAAMLAAIPKVLPDTGHFLCTWHINQNAIKNIGFLFGNEKLRKGWSDLLFSSDILDFEGAWSSFITEYQLQDNEWLQRIYNRRDKWAPAYVRKYFCAGKRSTQMSESFNSKLRQYVKSNMDLGRFFKQFQRVIDSVRENELQSDFQMQNERPISRVNDPLCDHVATIYTPKMLKEFEAEAEKSLYVRSDSTINLPEGKKVTVHIHERSHNCDKASKHEVLMAYDKITCSCNKFSFVGIPCCHMLSVMRRHDLDYELPEQYILQRWTRNARNIEIFSSRSSTQPAHAEDEKHICYQRITSAVNAQVLKHSNNPESWNIWNKWLASVTAELDALAITTTSTKIDEQNKRTKGSKLLPDGGVCKGMKIKERKFKGNKRPKSILERLKKSRSSTSKTSSSQTATARELILHDEEDDELDDEDNDNAGRFRDINDLMEYGSSAPI